MVGRAGHSMQYPGASDATYIVVHTTNGTLESVDARYNDPASEASAHYGVGLNGSVVQWVSESDTAYHADNWDVNLNSIGVQHEDGGSDLPRTDALYEASSRLVRELCLRYGIPISRQCIIGHRDVGGMTTTCPDSLDVDRITMMAAGSWQPALEPSQVQGASEMRPSPQPPPADASPPAPEPLSPLPAPVPAPAASSPMEVEPLSQAISVPPPAPGARPQPAPWVASRAAPVVPPHNSASPARSLVTVPVAPTGDPLRDVAAAVYGDSGRWQDIRDAIKNVATDLPGLVQMAKTLTTESAPAPDPVTPPPPDPQPAATIAVAGPSSPPPSPPPQQKSWAGSQGVVFCLQIVYLTILAVLAIIYFTNRNLIDLPETLGPVPVAVPWFGALGAVLISLVALTEHRNDWDPSYQYWHMSRPLLGASFGTISVLIFEAGILAVGTTPAAGQVSTPKNLLYFLVAFVVGYREETFRELIKRLTDVIFSPGPSPSASGPAISTISPQSGPAAGGTTVTVLGSGLSQVDSVRFGVIPAQFRVDGDGQVTVTSPPGQAGTAVSVSVGSKGVTIGAGTFAYV